MSKTVVVVDGSGSLVDVKGVNGESNGRYSKFSGRLIGDSSTAATVYFGWNGRNNLLVAKAAGTKTGKVTFDTTSVVITGALSVGGKSLDSIIAASIDTEMTGIVGVEGETTVTKVKNTDTSKGSPRHKYIVGLSPEILDRLSSLERLVDGLFRFSEYYKVGDGLIVDRTEGNVLNVNIGDGLKFAEVGPESEETTAITVDCDDVPTEGSQKPITSGGVYDALYGGVTPDYKIYTVKTDQESGNMVLLYNAPEYD